MWPGRPGLTSISSGFPLGPEHIAAGPIKGSERFGATAHRDVCGGGGCEVRRAAERRAGAGGAQAAVAEGEGDLLDWVGFRGGVAYNGEGAVDRLALRSLDCCTYLLPLAAPRQVCHPALEAAVEQQPPVLVCQGQGLHPVHDGAGVVGSSS
jgi:hypothetical protein